MNLKMYVIYDSKAETFTQPMCFFNRGAAIRAFVDILQDCNTNFSKHPEDYSLFEIGSYSESSGVIEAYSSPVSIGSSIEFMKPSKEAA